MLCMPNMTPTSLAAAVSPCTAKIIKNGLRFERGENLLQNGILHFAFKLIVRNRVTKLEFTQMKN